MTIIKKLQLIVAVILWVSSGPTFAKDLVVVGTASPPYLFEHQGRVVGIDAEILRSLFRKLGVGYQLVICPFERCWKMLKSGKADIGIGFSDEPRYQPHTRYPDIFTRNAEFVLMTNDATKAAYKATSLEYIKENKLKVGISRGEAYNERFWGVFPQDVDKKQHHPLLDQTSSIKSNFKKLSRNRVNVVPSERETGLFQTTQLGLLNISPYDFVILFKPIYNVFSKSSMFTSTQYRNIETLQRAYTRELARFKNLPAYHELFNWEWALDPTFTSSPQNLADQNIFGGAVNIGFLAALTGPDAGWGKPGLTGNEMFINEVNAAGGLLVDGVKYRLKMHVYDDEADPAKALAGAKLLTEKYNVRFISAIGGASADATHPYLTQKRVIYASLIATDIKPDRPYLLAGGDVTPRIDMLRPWYHKNKNSQLRRWAVVSQDDPIGRACQAWEVGSAIAEGWDVIYDRHFRQDTTNFSPLVADILDTKPDVISLNLTWPDFSTAIITELYKQGFTGEISGNYIDVESVLKQVPVWFLEGAVDSFPQFNDPFWGESSTQHTFYNDWQKQYGRGGPSDVKRQINGIDWDHVIMLKTWAYGAQLAGSFDPDKIIAALRNQKAFPTILGTAKMVGNEMWGIQNMVSPPIPINEVKSGEKRIQTIKRYDDWFDENKQAITSIVKTKGHYWK